MHVQDLWPRDDKNPDSGACDRHISKGNLLLVAALFAFSVAPTFISYQPYIFQWDDADYFMRAIGVNLAFWSGNSQALVRFMVSQHPPAMTLLGVPWGPLESWNAAGKCFVTLAAVISLLAVISLYLLLRIGVKPLYLVVASVCVGISLGPYPSGAPAHLGSTAFIADSLFAWAALAAVLLVPYEARTHSNTTRGSIVRGLLWGLILSLGMMAKLSFVYFVVPIVPLLFFMKLRRDGMRSALTALIAFVCCSSPFSLYLRRWGRQSFLLAKASAFGGLAGFYYSPLLQFLGNTVRESPGIGISLLLTVSALICVLIKRDLRESWPDILALLIMVGFGIIVMVSPNREIRFSFPVIIALPFLAAIFLSGKGHSVPSRVATVCSALVFCGLLAAIVPTRHRPDWRSLDRCNAVLAAVARLNVGTVLLASDSPTLNIQLMQLARLYSSRPVDISSFAYQGMYGVPIEEDFRQMSLVDVVVFQDQLALTTPFTNQRISEYERYARQVGLGPIRVADDISVYLMRKH